MAVLPESRWTNEFNISEGNISGIDAIWNVLEEATSEHTYSNCSRDGNIIKLQHDWLLSSCWFAYDLERVNNDVERTNFIVRKPENWQNPSPVTVEFEHVQSKQKIKKQPTLAEIIDTLDSYYPFHVDEVSADDLLNKCGDISELFKEALWHEFGIKTSVVRGGIYNPESLNGSLHGYIKLNPDDIADETEPIIIDGTAKQFNKDFDWSQTLGNKEEIDPIAVIRPSDENWNYYAENLDLFDT